MSTPSSSGTRVFVAGAIALAAGFAGFLAYRSHNGASTDASTLRPVAATESASAASAPAPADTATTGGALKPKAIPETLPDITLANLAGKPTRLATFAGRPLMLNFWATWCAPCRREIPLLNQLRSQRKAQNMEIVGIAVDFRDEVVKFTQKVPIHYPLLIGEEDGLAAADAFGVGMAFPSSVFVDSQNRVLAVKLGELHEDEANFAFDRILDVDSGRQTPVQARAAIADAFREMATKRATSKSANENHPE